MGNLFSPAVTPNRDVEAFIQSGYFDSGMRGLEYHLFISKQLSSNLRVKAIVSKDKDSRVVELAVSNGYLIQLGPAENMEVYHKFAHCHGDGGLFVHRTGICRFKESEETRKIRHDPDALPKIKSFLNFLYGPVVPNETLDPVL
jgi:hypothetical protein